MFPILAAALVLFPVNGASFPADPAAGSAPAATDNATGAVSPAAADPAAGTAPAATDNTTGAVAPAADNNWVDRYHTGIERNLYDSVVWFDRFFGNEWLVVTERPESYLRWMNDSRWDEVEGFTFRSTLRVTLRLPRLKERWRLTVTGESRSDTSVVRPEDPGDPGVEVSSRLRTGSTELIYDLLRTPRSTLDVGAGVHVKIPPNAFVRTRFQYARAIAYDVLGRLTVIAIWDPREGFGESNQVDIERLLAPPTLLRWSNSMNITEKSNGWIWGTELSLLHKISPKSVVTLAGGVSGSTRPAWIAQNYRVLVRYRRNIFREWLFLEGEPYLRWPRKEDGSREPVWGAILRVEILFIGAYLNAGSDGGKMP